MDRLKLLKQSSDKFLEHFQLFQSSHSVAHANNFFWFLDVFLAFDREYLLSSLSEPATNRNSEEQLLYKFLEKNA